MQQVNSRKLVLELEYKAWASVDLSLPVQYSYKDVSRIEIKGRDIDIWFKDEEEPHKRVLPEFELLANTDQPERVTLIDPTIENE